MPNYIKPGTWVRLKRNGKIQLWDETSNQIPSRFTEVSLWKPQPEESCWFYNEDTGVLRNTQC